MKDVMLGANRYVRGRGVLPQIGKLVSPLGKRAFIIGGNKALQKTCELLEASLKEQGIGYSVNLFTTEVCIEQVEAYRKRCLSEEADFVIAVGGGKAMDVGKWTADSCGLPAVTVPTCASTCASMVSLIVTYQSDGQANSGIYAKSSPWLCLADTDVIAAAPIRLMISGVADTLSKWAETHYAMRNVQWDTFDCMTSWLSRKVFDELCENSQDMIADAINGNHSAKLDELIDMILILSAMIGNTAGDEYRLAIGHSIHDGLIALNPDVVHRYYHGEKVGYGVLVQLALFKDGEDAQQIGRVYRMLKDWGLPLSLTDFGIPRSEEAVNRLVEASRGPKIRSGPSYTSVADLRNAIWRVEKKEFETHAEP